MPIKAENPDQVLAIPETTLPLPHTDPDFQYAGDLVVLSAKAIEKIVKESPKEQNNHGLEEEARQMSEHPRPVERLVGTVGPTGVGKSSLTCAILEQDGVAIVDGEGEAVTCFPVYYRYRLVSESAPFMVKCAFPVGKALETLLKTLLHDFNALDNLDEDTTAEDYNNTAEAFKAAEQSFIAVFGHLNGFSLDVLKTEEGGILGSTALPLLIGWTRQLPWPADLNDGLWTTAAEDIEELQMVLRSFRGNGLWPFIEGVHIYLDAPILRTGLVLIDLPGYQDSNLARVRIARRVQATCDDLLVCGEAKRAAANPVLQAVVDELGCARNGKIAQQTIVAVCTHSAVMDPGMDKTADKPALVAVRQARRYLRESRASRKERMRLKRREQKILMEGRKRHLTQIMQETYGSRLSNGLEVFCIDSKLGTDEDEDLDDDDDEDAAEELAAMSGLNELREYVGNLPRRELFRVNNSFIGVEFHALVDSLDNWVLGSMPQPGVMKAVLPGPDGLRQFHSRLALWKTDLLQQFKDTVVLRVRDADATIQDDAFAVARLWRSYHASSVMAFIRKEGVHKPAKAGRTDWNLELIGCFNKVTNRLWNDFDANLTSSFEMLRENITKAFQTYPDTCKRLGAPKPFLRALGSRQKGLQEHANVASLNFFKFFDRLKRNARESQAGSYVGEYMGEAYREASHRWGKGARAGRHDILESYVNDPALVNFFCDELERDFYQLTEKVTETLLRKIEITAKAIDADVENVQGRRDEIPLFKMFPEYGQQVEALLQDIKQRRKAIDELAAPARKTAVELWGEDFGNPVRNTVSSGLS